MPLKAPTEITTAADGTNAKAVKINWVEDPGNNSKKHSFRFVKKSDSLQYLPSAGETGTVTSGADNQQSVVITPGADSKVGAQELVKDYVAGVEADGAWGWQTYWTFLPSLTITIGSHTFTLTQLPHLPGGIYEAPVSDDEPFTIDWADIKEFANNIGLTLPEQWPNGDPIQAAVELTKLVVDTNNKLFTLRVAAKLDWNIITGLTINRVGVEIARTDGQEVL
jgi:hypothetical protein